MSPPRYALSSQNRRMLRHIMMGLLVYIDMVEGDQDDPADLYSMLCFVNFLWNAPGNPVLPRFGTPYLFLQASAGHSFGSENTICLDCV